MSLASLTSPLYAAARTDPGGCALIDAGRSYNYGELNAQVEGLHNWLLDSGVCPGQHLMVISEDKAAILRLLIACLRLGCLCIPVNPRFPEARLHQLIEQSGTRWLINDTDHDLRESRVTQLFSPALTTLSELGMTTADRPTCDVDPCRPLTGVFTSGTTGSPKLALHSYRNHYFSALGSRDQIPLGPGDGWALTLPLYHIGGLAIIFRCMLARASLIIPPAKAGLEQLLQDRALNGRLSHLSAVATQLVRLQEQGFDLEGCGLRYLLLGGSAFPAPLLRWLDQQAVAVKISYGLTEMSSQVVTGTVNSESRLGQLLPHRALCLSTDSEVWVRGETLFLGYYHQGAICLPLDKEGWFHTRDLGTRDPSGDLKITGRQDNQFVCGGENIQPEEIEAVIRDYPGIRECYVVPVDDPEFGLRPVCFIRGSEPLADRQQLTLWLRARLPGYQVPRHFFALDNREQELKISRRWLVQQAMERLNGSLKY